jgi:hypothetical protein
MKLNYFYSNTFSKILVFQATTIFKFSLIIFIMIIELSNVEAASFPPASSCTSKDLELVSATLPGTNTCNTCTPGTTITRTLYVAINNKTGSNRTAFAFWANLEIYNDDGTLDAVHSGPISGCVGAVPRNTITSFPSPVSITYNCGQSLVLKNLYLAWTDASPSSTCPTLLGSPSTINPKCGTLPQLQINAGVNATVAITNATCTSNGTLNVSPFGGKSPYNISIGAVNYTGVVSSATFTNLPQGIYAINITDANGCTITKSKTIGFASSLPPAPISGGDKAQCELSPLQTLSATASGGPAIIWYNASSAGSVVANPILNSIGSVTYYAEAVQGSCVSTSRTAVKLTINPKPATATICVVQPSLCGPVTGSVSIIAPLGSNYLYSVNNGNQWQSSASFPNLTAGSVTGILVKNSDGCISNPTGCDQSNCAAIISPNSSAQFENSIRKDEINKFDLSNERAITVTPYPNPFNDRIKFIVNIPEEGNCDFELFNIVGQEVKTIYKGFVKAGINDFEINLNDNESGYLIYKFNMGEKQLTGKLFRSIR